MLALKQSDKFPAKRCFGPGRVVGQNRLGRREQAKDERRTRIVAAARDLMREAGVDAVSMKQVAARADVSLSTIYNLFGSKEEVFAQVFNGAFEAYRGAVLARASADPLQRFFDAIDIAAEFYSADVPFYRSSVWLVDADSSYKLSLQKPRFSFFRDLAGQSIEAGLLRRDADAYVLGLMIVPMFSTPYQAWAGGWIGIDEFRARAKLGICLVLRGFCAPAHRDRVRSVLGVLETQVKACRRVSRPRSNSAG